MTVNPHKVALVIDRKYGKKLVELSRKLHVWACKSPENMKAAREIWDETGEYDLESGVTTFDINEDDTPEDICLSYVGTIDEHHGEYSHDPPWTIIEVHGTSLTPLIKKEFLKYGKGNFKSTAFGFVFERIINNKN